jgi:hypothetical protein
MLPWRQRSQKSAGRKTSLLEPLIGLSRGGASLIVRK